MTKLDYIFLPDSVLITGYDVKIKDFVEIRLEGESAREFHKWHIMHELRKEEFLHNIAKKCAQASHVMKKVQKSPVKRHTSERDIIKEEFKRALEKKE